MNTSARIHSNVAPQLWSTTDRTYAAFAFFVGLIAFVTGVAVDSDALAILGFLPLIIGGLYLNGIFWAKVFDKLPGVPTRSENYRY